MKSHAEVIKTLMKRPGVKAVVEGVDNEEEKTRMTKAALAEVEQKALIPHQEMLSWGESLDTANPFRLLE